MKNRKKEIIAVSIILVIQTIIYVCVGINKSYIHIDEAYSYGLTNYERLEIQDNEDFYNNWHTKEYYEDYLAVQEDEIGKYGPVYENQKNDVHPPLYYLILRFAMNFTQGHFSKWAGISLNIIIYMFVTIFMYLILKELFKEEKYTNIKSTIVAFMSSVILASLSNVIYIRMYALSTLNILITTYLHIKLLKSEKISYKLLIAIGFSALAGVLTHYYYLFYLVMLYLVILIKYIKQKQVKSIIAYTVTMIISAITSLIIFPYSIQHMFLGYRGQGVISKFGNIKEMIPSITEQIKNLNYYVFNSLMFILIPIMIGILIYNKIRKREGAKISKEKREILKIIYLPTIFFFIITTLASPWNVLRYIVPVCGLIFILVIYYLHKLLQTIFEEKINNIILISIFYIILITPFIFKMKPELLYNEQKFVVAKIEELNIPAIYLYNVKQGRFLDDILIFSKINESYITKEIDYTADNLQNILEDKNISKGILILINEGEKNEKIINEIKNNLNFTEIEYLNKLSACEVYYIK